MIRNPKFVFVVGSIMSGLGKGILTASIAKILSSRGYKAVPIKFDGYLNVDCGTMNPFRHGEVFVLDDGGEVDMDFGTYERFLNFPLSSANSITGGKLFKAIIEKERKGDYLGKDVQFVPHLTDEIKQRILTVYKTSKADVVIVEVGGTVGDIENGYFLEAVRQLMHEHKSTLVQLTYVPSISPGEQKTKPTQHANRLVKSLGLSPDIIVCREDEKLKREAKEKISLYCNVKYEDIYDDPKVKTVYELPLVIEKQGIYNSIAEKIGLEKGRQSNLRGWKTLVERVLNPKKTVKVAIVGKYTAVKDAYVSIYESLEHSCAHTGIKSDVEFIESTYLEQEKPEEILSGFDGIIVPGGFGRRGVEGKINAIRYARENKVPFLGLCLGMQLMVVEYARHVCGMKDANSREFNSNTPYPVISLLKEQERITEKGGTMRLGAYEAELKEGTIAWRAYGKNRIWERHRHRYEVNPEFVEILESHGLVFSGIHPTGKVVEIAEWPEKYGFGIASQAHLELKSRFESPAPIFVEFVKACSRKSES